MCTPKAVKIWGKEREGEGEMLLKRGYMPREFETGWVVGGTVRCESDDEIGLDIDVH